MTDIAAWLTAQLDHDEQEIRRRQSIPDGYAHDGPCVNYEDQDPATYDEYDSCSRHLAATETARRDGFPYRNLDFGLRQVATGRALIAAWNTINESASDRAWWYADRVEAALVTLAAVYADRSGYDPAWVA